MLGFNEMVLRESRDEEITRYSENIRSAGKTLLAMISDMMDFTEMETGSFRIEETNYSAASMLSDIASFAGYHANKKDIELRLDFSPDIPRTLHGDSVRITRILNDLTSNAVKYTERGWVEIQVGWEPDGDSGCSLKSRTRAPACVRRTSRGYPRVSCEWTKSEVRIFRG